MRIRWRDAAERRESGAPSPALTDSTRNAGRATSVDGAERAARSGPSGRLSRWQFFGSLAGAVGLASLSQVAAPARSAQAQSVGPWTEDAPTNAVYLTNAGGKVGIGTSDPFQRIHVVDAGTNPKVLVQSQAAGSQPELQLQGNDASGGVQYANLYNAAGWHVGLWLGDAGGGSTKLAVTPTGRVGIGTMNPSGTLHLGSGDLWIGTQKVADAGGVFYAA